MSAADGSKGKNRMSSNDDILFSFALSRKGLL